MKKAPDFELVPVFCLVVGDITPEGRFRINANFEYDFVGTSKPKEPKISDPELRTDKSGKAEILWFLDWPRVEVEGS